VRKFIPAVILLPILVIACTTLQGPGVPIPTLSQASAKSLGYLLESGSYLQALQGISYLRNERPSQVPPTDLDALESRALAALSADFRAAVGEKRFDDAIRLYRSALSLGKPDLVPGWTEKNLELAGAERLDASGQAVSALIARLHALSLDQPTGDELSDALQYASKLGNIAAVRVIAEKMKDLGLQIPAFAAAQLAAPVDFAKMIKGTVTIWVDRGIKMVNGLGTPDRVIGSGFFIDPRGYLLTNYHVIQSEVDPAYEGYSRLFIELSSEKGERIPAKVVGYDTVFDIALVKVELSPEFVFSGLSGAELGPGSRIFAIGSPAGLEKTVTSGIVSYSGRRFLPLGDTLQVDVPLNPGNSGGPLLNETGDVIGVVFAGLEQFEGLNFAIPYLWIQKMLPRLYAGGEVSHPWLGMALQETSKGLEVIYSMPNEPAYNAGIEVGDIVEAIDGVAYKNMKDIQEALLTLSAPSLVRVTFSRDGVRHEEIICLSARPEHPIEEALKRDTLERVLYPLYGMRLEGSGSYFWRSQFIVQGVLSGSVADESGISENDELVIQSWQVDMEKKIGILQIFAKKRKMGYLESVIQIGAYLETNNFL
jgi:S1-C subfamily serine protease